MFRTTRTEMDADYGLVGLHAVTHRNKLTFNVFLIRVIFFLCVLGEIQTRVPASIWPVVSPLHESWIFTFSWSEWDGKAECSVRQLISRPLHVSPTREKRNLPLSACPTNSHHAHFLWREILRHAVSSLHRLAFFFLDVLKIRNLLTLILLTWRIGWAHNNARK